MRTITIHIRAESEDGAIAAASLARLNTVSKVKGSTTMKKVSSVIAVVMLASVLAGCAGNGNHILREVPSIQRILNETPQL